MSLLFLSVIFFLGACVGSFGSVVIGSYDSSRSILTGRSHCEGCKKILKWYELIPLVSYALQEGTCRDCDSKIPRWIWYNEWAIAFLWLIGCMVLNYGGFSTVSIAIHISILTMLALITTSDIRIQIIPDRVSIPLIVFILLSLLYYHFYPTKSLLPAWDMAIMGAFIGMLFYMLQMIIPASIDLFKNKKHSHLWTIALAPFLFPAWMITKVFVGEKRADWYFPSLDIFEHLPSWVGGGDIRLGFALWLLVGPYGFIPVIMYGYVLGTIFFLVRWGVFRNKMVTMPVAPLIFFWLLVYWFMMIFPYYKGFLY